NWATIFSQVYYDKVEESIRLETAGIPVPKWISLREDEIPDLSGFSDFVVVKPAASACGAMVRIMRRNRVRWRDLGAEKMRCDNRSLIVQEYIHTGPWPTSYRVATVFGEPVYMFRAVADRTRRPFDTMLKGSLFFDGRTIVSSGKGCIMDEEVPDDVIQMGVHVHRAFPDEPFIAADIIREHETGKLFVLEANTSGWSFLNTAPIGEKLKREFRIDFVKQFNAPKAMARGIYSHLCGPCFCREEASING
ncbi:MAG: hypothetical protein HY351_04715, partial [Candidatus Omnitrophica bacterium]|nr:hypothetical protein [Candidatus Omnitrophota bacterium]